MGTLSNWRRYRHFTWSSEPREGPATCSAQGVPSFLSYLKILSVGPVPGIETATARSAVKRSTDWANLAAVKRNLRNSLVDNHSWINNQTDIFVVHLFISSAKEKFYPRKEYNPHHIGVSKQWNGGHVCVSNHSCGSSVKSFCYVNNFLLFQEICTSCRPSEWEGSISIFFRCCLDIKIFIVIFFLLLLSLLALLRVFILNITLLIPLRDLRSNKQTFWL